MADAQNGIYNFTQPAVLIFPSLLEAKKFKNDQGKEQGEPKFGASFMFTPDHPDLAAIKAHVATLAKAKWPGRDLGAAIKAGDLKLPWETGEKAIERKKMKLKKKGKEYYGKQDFMLGHVVIKGSSKYQPRLSIFQGGKPVDLEGAGLAANSRQFYFGTQALAQLNFVAYDAVNEGKDGVTAYLNLVLSLNKGERMAGGQSSADAFKGYVGQSTTEDPAAGLSDEGF